MTGWMGRRPAAAIVSWTASLFRFCFPAFLGCILPDIGAAAAPDVRWSAEPGVIEKGAIRFTYDNRGPGGLANPGDPFGAAVMPPQSRLELLVRCRAGNAAWIEVGRGGEWTASPETGTVAYTNAGTEAPIEIRETFRTDGRVLDWTIELASTVDAPVTVGDLAINVPAAGPRGEDPRQIFEHGFLRHQFVSGHGAFVFFVRASGAPPYLVVTVRPGTRIEYTDSGGGRGGGRLYVHSARAGGAETLGTWRQAHTALELAPRGRPGSRAVYGFRLQFADGYDGVRDVLYEEGLFDVRVVPGMTVPEDLTARFSLRTRARIESIRAEFPDLTTLRELGQPRPGCRVYEVAFRRLGENMLTIVHDGGRETCLEFFVTEPLETLIRKRAAFIAGRQQIKDPGKWWDGVYGPYDMKAEVVRTIEDPDIFLGRMIYVLTCDDPGLCKAPFLAAKNVVFPDPAEIASIEYYLEHFVWGGLQRRDDERPYPYGIYGTPEWFTNRDPARRAASTKENLDKEHVWRSYDYPHAIMLYYHMYQVAKMYPGTSRYLDAAGYLERAWGTARAFYTYPYEIFPAYYETSKWGLYNELVVLDLIEALESEGFPEQAAWLRAEWEKKAKYFIYDDEYPFRSEYAFDRTAFESTYALAKYGATRDMAPDRNLWFDLKHKKWYSHPFVRREDARRFMDRQLAAGLSVRGWLETSYHQLGADPSMSYMAAMGGWGILDYALNFAPRPAEWLQLGYASYLSSWCLMNTGRPETGYGFWFPGPRNDGAAGWQFMSAKAGNAWMGSSFPGGVRVPRGPWHYDGEIDLGFGGALRMAATIVTSDPIFGWFAYGGAMTEAAEALAVEPRDGLRRRLHVVIPDRRLPFADASLRFKMEFARDGFAAGRPIALDKALARIAFTAENRTGAPHRTSVRFSFPVESAYMLRQDGRPVRLEATGNWDYPWRAELALDGESSAIELRRIGRLPAAGTK